MSVASGIAYGILMIVYYYTRRAYMTNLMRASNEWYSRPDDQRFLTLEALHQATLARAQDMTIETVDLDKLEFTGKREYKGEQYKDNLLLSAPTSMGQYKDITPTHWSFGQLCQRAGAPASYLKKLHPELTAVNLNYTMQVNSDDTKGKLMVAASEELACITGKDYGRIWDHQVAKMLLRLNEETGNQWVVPAASYSATDPLRATTLYASDRDMFAMLVNESNGCEIIDKWGKVHNLNKFLIVWNSEVGKTTLGATFGNYDFICDNRIVWGAKNVQELRIRHSKYAPDRFGTEMKPLLTKYAGMKADTEARIFKTAMEMEVAKDEKGISSWLNNKGFNSAEQKRIIQQGKSDRGGQLPDTVWEIVAAGTAAARAIAHTDTRVDFERKASKLLDLAERKSEYIAA